MSKVRISIQGFYDGDWVEEYLLEGRGDTANIEKFLIKRYKNLEIVE